MKNFSLLLCLLSLTLAPVYAQENLSSYANYDFIPGEKVIFSDNFASTTKGEFPNQWTLTAGQAVTIDKAGSAFMAITEGSYGSVAPAMKTDKYLGENFTIEFDYYYEDQHFPIIKLIDANEEGHEIHFSHMVATGYFNPDLRGTAAFPDGNFGTLHHAAMIYKNGQMKCYIDQSRSLVIPSCGFKPLRVEFMGSGGEGLATYFSNVRIAEGGDMNMWNKLMKDGKIITQGIYFDVNKAELKPQSMGVLNEIAKMIKEHPELKLEIGGHTDSDGDDAANLTLSQKRADAVKAQLVKMGADGAKLITKGYGESKPVSDNNSAQGKANNRRVEFVKM